MKFITAIGLTLLPSLAAVLSVQASAGAGAVYFLTNEPNGNFIVSCSIGANGTLTLGEAFSVGGTGANGLIGIGHGPGPDPLFSQGVITVSGNQVFTVNPGSGSVAVFDIDPQCPTTLSMVGQPVSSGGDFPVSIAVSKKSGQACVLNTGTVNTVSCFKQSGNSLVPVPNTTRSLGLNQTNPASGPSNTASQVLFNHDESKLLVAVKGVNTTAPGYLATWDVNPLTGALSESFNKIPLPQGGGQPFSITPIPGKNAVILSDHTQGYDVFDFDANKSASVTVPNQLAICWSTFSQKTGNYYMIDSGNDVITEVTVPPTNVLQASSVKQYQIAPGGFLLDADVATISGNDFMYILAPGFQSIVVFALPEAETLTQIQNLTFADALAAKGVKTDVFALVGLAAYTP